MFFGIKHRQKNDTYTNTTLYQRPIVLICTFLFLAVLFSILLLPNVTDSAQNFSLTVTVINLSNPECSDGLDNDGDGKSDFPDDPGCDSSSDDDETDPVIVGAGGGWPVVPPRAFISGIASPEAKVFLLKDGQLFNERSTSSDGSFRFVITDVSAGNHLFGLYFSDRVGRVSPIFSFLIGLRRDVIVDVSDILLAPTVQVNTLDISEDPISISGFTAPGGVLSLQLIDPALNATTSLQSSANKDGLYVFSLTDYQFTNNTFTFIIQSILGSLQSEKNTFTFIPGEDSPLRFQVIEETEEELTQLPQPVCSIPGDYNCDGRVNIIDFSILLYWFERSNPPAHIDLNNDGKVNLSDFSIMAFHWTG